MPDRLECSLKENIFHIPYTLNRIPFVYNGDNIMTSKFKEALESDRFIVTSEVAPPKGTDLEKLTHHIELLMDKVDAMNVTDHQSSVMR